MGKLGKKAGKGHLPPTSIHRRTDASKTHLRSQRTIRRLRMYQSKVARNEKGEIVKGSVLSAADKVQQSMARIAPDRRWFGNTRVIGQTALQQFRQEMKAAYHDPYSVVLKQRKLPLSLLEEPAITGSAPKMELQWEATFGGKATRKRVRGFACSMEALRKAAVERTASFELSTATDLEPTTGGSTGENTLTKGCRRSLTHDMTKMSLMKKGQSNRIWGELYKVIDSSDVICYVLDARDPLGTRSAFVERYMRTEKKYKHFVFILNKCDLIPLWATSRWLQVLSKDFPTIAFRASIEKPFGKGNAISLLRQFSQLHNVTHRGNSMTKTPISIGVIGYPNVGKSSFINTLRRGNVCKSAPIPGETKVWQYVALTRSIFLIDSPGVVYDREANDDVSSVLKGVVRVERLGAADKIDVVHDVLEKVRPHELTAAYGVASWRSTHDFLTQLARRRGKLLHGGEADIDVAARIVLYDWQRGRLPWFHSPPFASAEQQQELMAQLDSFHQQRIDQLELGLETQALGEPQEKEGDKTKLKKKKRRHALSAAQHLTAVTEDAVWTALLEGKRNTAEV